MNSSQESNIPIVLITGFDSSGSVMVNSSWEIAKALKIYLDWTRPIHLILKQLEVTYDDVRTKIPDYWIKYNPTLVIHLGLAKGSKEIRLERFAYNADYCHADNEGTVPEIGQCIKNDSSKRLMTSLPIRDICARVQRQTNLPIIVSDNAGRYLCEYIYYQSLFIDSKRTIFIHMPDLDDNFTIENLAQTIQFVVYEALRYVDPLPILNENGNYLINKNNVSMNYNKLKSNKLF
ncbi:unnamed protein product [Rotaria socialis]|uniref:Pyroglutamyl-peptidase 1 n=1 Tax=Rotaria socialis TaxID=392032 RepID=A0A820MJA1_9BILA|nr:unnamed protein product [Rotaria socialis]CAF3271970.1 unnamed protein product [Rotaria socialis]CAF3387845.1 unnamed protein product [Rotaria socialis]CAF3513295.1 unnamed protein product [Rotaria socialis]CAF4351019.1 unnamed protein product [Rotaria socialis]